MAPRQRTPPRPTSWDPRRKHKRSLISLPTRHCLRLRQRRLCCTTSWSFSELPAFDNTMFHGFPGDRHELHDILATWASQAHSWSFEIPRALPALRAHKDVTSEHCREIQKLAAHWIRTNWIIKRRSVTFKFCIHGWNEDQRVRVSSETVSKRI